VRARQVLEALEPLEIDADVLASVAHNLWLAKSSLDLVLRASVFKYVVEDRGDLIVPGEIPEKDGFIPPELIYRLRRVAIRWVGGANYAPRSKAMFELEDGLREKGMHTLGGCIFRMVEGKKIYERRFRITREYNAVRNVVSSTDAPWDGRWVLEGPHDAELQVRALGDAVKNCQDWRDTGLPRQSLLASPAIWRGDELVAAPLAGLENGWTASAIGRGTFSQFLLSR
jgi:tRNA(Ile)-lysidine synthase